jgi:hypothetical protein
VNGRDALRQMLALAAAPTASCFSQTSEGPPTQAPPGKVQNHMPSIASPDANTRTPRYRMPEGLTPTKLIGNAVATLVVSKWEGALDEEKLRRGLG